MPVCQPRLRPTCRSLNCCVPVNCLVNAAFGSRVQPNRIDNRVGENSAKPGKSLDRSPRLTGRLTSMCFQKSLLDDIRIIQNPAKTCAKLCSRQQHQRRTKLIESLLIAIIACCHCW